MDHRDGVRVGSVLEFCGHSFAIILDMKRKLAQSTQAYGFFIHLELIDYSQEFGL